MSQEKHSIRIIIGPINNFAQLSNLIPQETIP